MQFSHLGVSSWTLSKPGSQLSHDGGPPVIIECLTHGLAVTPLQQHCLSQTQSQCGGGESSHYHRQCQSTMHDTVSQVQVRAMEVEVVSCLQVHPPLPSAASLPSTWLLRDAVPAADESCSSSEGGLSQPTVAACRLWQPACGERQAMQAQALQPTPQLFSITADHCHPRPRPQLPLPLLLFHLPPYWAWGPWPKG